MDNALREKAYFDTRATKEMAQHLRAVPRTTQETMAYACRILATVSYTHLTLPTKRIV